MLLVNGHDCMDGSPCVSRSNAQSSPHYQSLDTAQGQQRRMMLNRSVQQSPCIAISKLCRLTDLQIHPNVQSTQNGGLPKASPISVCK